jgi:hypothetical protein
MRPEREALQASGARSAKERVKNTGTWRPASAGPGEIRLKADATSDSFSHSKAFALHENKNGEPFD